MDLKELNVIWIKSIFKMHMKYNDLAMWVSWRHYDQVMYMYVQNMLVYDYNECCDHV